MRNNYNEELTYPVSQGFSQFSTFTCDFDARTLKTVTDTKLEIALIQRTARLPYRKNWITVVQKIKYYCVTHSSALPFLGTVTWQFCEDTDQCPSLSVNKSNGYINKRINFCYNLALPQSSVGKKRNWI